MARVTHITKAMLLQQLEEKMAEIGRLQLMSGQTGEQLRQLKLDHERAVLDALSFQKQRDEEKKHAEIARSQLLEAQTRMGNPISSDDILRVQNWTALREERDNANKRATAAELRLGRMPDEISGLKQTIGELRVGRVQLEETICKLQEKVRCVRAGVRLVVELAGGE